MRPPKSLLYASVHPEDADGFDDLFSADERLALNDTGLEVQMMGSHGSGGEGGGPSLGPGIRVHFQGLLHVEVFRQQLTDEFGINADTAKSSISYHHLSKQKEQYSGRTHQGH
jgi:translation elongation factor EF-4